MTTLDLNIPPQQAGERLTLFADVILPLPLPKLFTYRVPYEMNAQVKVGVRVIVPFGQKKVMSCIVGRVHAEPPKDYQSKYLLEVIDEEPVVTELQLKLFNWIADYYLCSIGEVITAALPSALKLSSESKVQLHPAWSWESNQYELSNEEQELIDALTERGTLGFSEVAALLDRQRFHAVVKSLIQKEVVQVFEEMGDRYTPKVVKKVRLAPQWVHQEEELERLFELLAKKPKQLDIVLNYLAQVPIHQNVHLNEQGLDKQVLLSNTHLSTSSLNTLTTNGVMEQFEVIQSRFPSKPGDEATVRIMLSEAQQQAMDSTLEQFTSKDIVLLHGITGSGKTEIYIELIRKAMEGGGQVLYLLPEIALTAQIVNRLRKVFGSRLGVYHSKFSDNERVEVWNGIISGRFQVVVGVRSAVFLPFDSLSLIIVDEEHESSYKQYEPAPRYNAREVSMMLAVFHKAKVLLGSATPSTETYYNTQIGRYGLVTLNKRFGEGGLPKIVLVDTRVNRPLPPVPAAVSRKSEWEWEPTSPPGPLSKREGESSASFDAEHQSEALSDSNEANIKFAKGSASPLSFGEGAGGEVLRNDALNPMPGAQQHIFTTTTQAWAILKGFAKQNRSEPTAAEEALWQAIRNRQVDGHKFRRQHAIYDFIADFVCLEKQLVVEVDGDYHTEEDQKLYDAARTQVLNEAGFKVLRLWNGEVLENLPAALNKIRSALANAAPNSDSDIREKFQQNNPTNTNHTPQEEGDIIVIHSPPAPLAPSADGKGPRSVFSPYLLQEMEARLMANEQVILFQNRRGYAPYITCNECNWIPTCQNCAVSLSYHKYNNELRCHYCGYHERLHDSCPACGSTYIRSVGFGTEKVEDELKIFIPLANVQRMDLDTTRAKNAYQQIIQDFEQGKTHVLVGTQMVTKGLDFEHVSMVGIVNADSTINLPDYRAHERAYQLFVQVAGRAGRRGTNGKVLVQTTNPQHPIFRKVIENNYLAFYEAEINERRKYGYPPFMRMIRLTVKHEEEKTSENAAIDLCRQLIDRLGKKQVLGPEAPYIFRIRNQYLHEVHIKLEREHTNLKHAKQLTLEAINAVKLQKPYRQVKIVIDVDPV